MSNATCPHCQKSVRPGTRFCPHCGQKIDTPSSSASPPSALPSACPHCGAPLRPGAKFCGRCGQSSAAPARPVVSPSPPFSPAAAPPPFRADPQPPAPSRAIAFPRWGIAAIALLVVLLALGVGLLLYQDRPVTVDGAAPDVPATLTAAASAPTPTPPLSGTAVPLTP